jgi:serine/threonine protein kinase
MMTTTNYQIINKIYESANSLVYRAVRAENNQPIILKVLKEDYPTPAELLPATACQNAIGIEYDFNS